MISLYDSLTWLNQSGYGGGFFNVLILIGPVADASQALGTFKKEIKISQSCKVEWLREIRAVIDEVYPG